MKWLNEDLIHAKIRWNGFIRSRFICWIFKMVKWHGIFQLFIRIIAKMIKFEWKIEL